MAPFSSLLSDKKKEEKLRPGAVIYYYCPVTTPPKYKYQVICNIDPLLVLLINSRIHEFIANRPELLRCQVSLKSEDYDFLKYDSHLNCVDAHECYEITNLKEMVVSNYREIYKGELLPNSVREVIAAINESTVMAPINKKRITSSLNDFLNLCSYEF